MDDVAPGSSIEFNITNTESAFLKIPDSAHRTATDMRKKGPMPHHCEFFINCLRNQMSKYPNFDMNSEIGFKWCFGLIKVLTIFV